MSIKYLTFYYPNGQKKSEGNYDGQEPIGDHTSWFESGNIKCEAVDLTESKILFTHWYENGQMKSKGVHKDYFESGLWTYWYDNGNKKSEGFYLDKDERVGKWKFWHSNGELACIGIHKGWSGDGLWTFWDEAGNKVHEREYRELELLDVWKNLRADGCSDELVDKYKKYIFN